MQDIFDKLKKMGDFVFAFAIIGILMVLLFPVPTHLLDFLLALSIGAAFIILMTTLFIVKPLDLSVFPTILLITTLLRLALNIASTRLILARGHSGSDAAGYVIEAFGGFVMQGNVVIGLIVFLILTLINFIVITKGSGRIAEVAARFSLDAMPGKQMAIDADLSAGLINEHEAKTRRKTLEDESTFFGAMDGANKFVRGDAIAGLIITFINLIGGMIVGIVQKNLSFDVAVQTYTMLTIGDGLVSQIPSLIISMSAGLLVTKAGTTGTTDKIILDQLGRYPQALAMTALVTCLMAFLPGLPFGPFIMISLSTAIMAYISLAFQEGKDMFGLLPDSLLQAASTEKTNNNVDSSGNSGHSSAETHSKGIATDEDISQSLSINLISLEIGYGLLPIVRESKSHNLTEQIKGLRKQIAEEYGFVLPSIRIIDNIHLEHETYVIKIKELEAGTGFVRVGKIMVMDPHGNKISIAGEVTKEPAFGLPAKWVDESNKEEALFNNLTVVDPSTVITTHITELVKENITDLLSYSETQKLIDELQTDHKQLVKDVIPEIVSVSTIQKVLQNLLSEMVSIRDLPSIIESIADATKTSKDLTHITESVRASLSRQISHNNTNQDGFIPIISLSPVWEQTFIESIKVDNNGQRQLTMAPSKLQDFIARVKNTFDEQASKGHLPVLLTSSFTRPYVRSIIQRFRPSTVVLSQNEIHYKSKVRTFATI